MAARKKVKHVVTIGGINGVGGDLYSIMLPDIYAGFNGVSGVRKVLANEDLDYKGRINSDDYKDGKVIRIKCRAAIPTIGGQRVRDFGVICSVEKLNSGLAALEDKTIIDGSETWNILTTRIPRRRRFS